MILINHMTEKHFKHREQKEAHKKKQFGLKFKINHDWEGNTVSRTAMCNSNKYFSISLKKIFLDILFGFHLSVVC